MLENENPTIYNVSDSDGNRDENFYDKLIASEEISRYGFDPNRINPLDIPSIPTPIERSVHLALQSIDKDYNEDGVVSTNNNGNDPLSILRAAGMLPPGIDEHDDNIIRVRDEIKLKFPNVFRLPYFVPADELKSSLMIPTLPKILPQSSGKRDAIEAVEVFDVIRNIQDPEHPLTLEQLNVVNLDHVTVKDVPDGKNLGIDEYSMVDIKFT